MEFIYFRPEYYSSFIQTLEVLGLQYKSIFDWKHLWQQNQRNLLHNNHFDSHRNTIEIYSWFFSVFRYFHWCFLVSIWVTVILYWVSFYWHHWMQLVCYVDLNPATSNYTGSLYTESRTQFLSNQLNFLGFFHFLNTTCLSLYFLLVF